MSVAAKPIGALIRAARHQKGWTQSQLATAINTRERNIIRWENDQHEPRMKHVAAIAEATGKDIEFFFGDEEETGDAEDEDAAAVSRLSLDEFLRLRIDALLAERVPAARRGARA